MTIGVLKITKDSSGFTVDRPASPGSPPVGRGRTMYEAIGAWMIANQTQFGVSFDVTEVQATENRRRARELGKR